MVVERRNRTPEIVPMEQVDIGFQGHHHHSLDESETKVENGSEAPNKNTGKNVIRGLLDPNTYATKKTIAQGLLDVALLTANASQLKYLLQVGERHQFYTVMISLISISIILQLAVGVLFFFIAKYNINLKSDQANAELCNNIATIGVFFIVVVNVFIATFGVTDINNPWSVSTMRPSPEELQRDNISDNVTQIVMMTTVT